MTLFRVIKGAAIIRTLLLWYHKSILIEGHTVHLMNTLQFNSSSLSLNMALLQTTPTRVSKVKGHTKSSHCILLVRSIHA